MKSQISSKEIEKNSKFVPRECNSECTIEQKRCFLRVDRYSVTILAPETGAPTTPSREDVASGNHAVKLLAFVLSWNSKSSKGHSQVWPHEIHATVDTELHLSITDDPWLQRRSTETRGRCRAVIHGQRYSRNVSQRRIYR